MLPINVRATEKPAEAVAPPLTGAPDLPPGPGDAASLQAERRRPPKGRRAIRVFAALALFFTGYVAALLTDFAAPELISKFGIRATEFGDLGQSSSALDELAALRRDLQVAREETSIAKDKEAEWMRVFAADDTKALALSRDLEAARKEITDYVATVGALARRAVASKRRNGNC